ncbi:MAG: helix-turn-helix domain-containing protein [Pseudomonadota bacterium]
MDITLYIAPGFNLTATYAFIDAFNAVNEIEAREVYGVHVVSGTGGPVSSHQGPAMDTVHVDEVRSDSDIVVISTSSDPQAAYGLPLSKHLRYWRRREALMIGLESGAFVLAEGSFLKVPACVHPLYGPEFEREFPNVGVSGALFDASGEVRTCVGGAAALDMALSLLSERHDADLVRAVRDFLMAPEPRRGAMPVVGGAAAPLTGALPPALMTAIDQMKAALDRSISVPDLAKETGLSQRQLERLFKAHTGRSPNQYYRMLRLDRAREMVTRGSEPIPAVATACGFVSPVHFSRAYKEQFGRAPMRDRIRNRIG